MPKGKAGKVAHRPLNSVRTADHSAETTNSRPCSELEWLTPFERQGVDDVSSMGRKTAEVWFGLVWFGEGVGRVLLRGV